MRCGNSIRFIGPAAGKLIGMKTDKQVDKAKTASKTGRFFYRAKKLYYHVFIDYLSPNMIAKSIAMADPPWKRITY